MKYIIIDSRMREVEKSLLKSMGYVLVELQKSDKTYPEISSHVDIFACKIQNTTFIEKSKFEAILSQIDPQNIYISARSVRNSACFIQKT